VCLNVGCIPSKALLDAAKVIEDAQRWAGAASPSARRSLICRGCEPGEFSRWQADGGPQRPGEAAQGRGGARCGRFVSANVLEVMGASGSQRIHFDQCIIAAGSEAARLPGCPKIANSRLDMRSSCRGLSAFAGGGRRIIGWNGCVFDALGSRVSVVELTRSSCPDATRTWCARSTAHSCALPADLLAQKSVAGIEREVRGAAREFRGDKAPPPQTVEHVLWPSAACHGKTLSAELAGREGLDAAHSVDRQMRTNVPHIFRDCESPHRRCWLTRPCTRERWRGSRRRHNARQMARDPLSGLTDPEIAWVGSPTDARGSGTASGGCLPLVANGRSLSLGREEGFTKLLFDPDITAAGGGIVGSNAGS